MKNTILIICCLFIGLSAHSQGLLNQSFSAANIDHFIVSNIAGAIEVKEGNSDQIKVRTIIVDGQLEDGLSIDYKQGTDFLMVYFKSPCTKEKSAIQFDATNPSEIRNWKKDCNWKRDEEQAFPNIKFIIELPKNIHLYAFTVMDGDIEVSKIASNVWANNVNGHIRLDQVAKVYQAKTVNGDITISYQEKPTVDAEFSTINGDINIHVPPKIQATTSFKTFSGDFYTDLKPIAMLPGTMKEQNQEKGFKYKVENKRRMKIDGGGPLLDFETFNGDVYLTMKE